MMIKTVRDHYEQFYKDYGTWLWTATLALSIPMFLRAINMGMMAFPWYFKLYFTHYTIMIAYYVFIMNVLPWAT